MLQRSMRVLVLGLGLVLVACGCASTIGSAAARRSAPAGDLAAWDAPVKADAGYVELSRSLDEPAPAANQGRAAAPAPAAETGVERRVIYSGGLRLVVVSTPESLARIQALASAAGGWLQESDARSITVRVPAERFEAVMNSIAGLGAVVDRTVKASDVTEQWLDVEIRLDNARKARARLLEHLEKSEKIEDTLKIEAELTRVTGEIEQFEGKLRYLSSQVAMSTIRVELNSRAPRSGDAGGLATPFRWIERLGDGLVAGTVESQPNAPGFWWRLFFGGPKFDPPPAFIRYYRSDERAEAMNAEGLHIKVQEHENYDRGELAFWSVLARTSLVQSRALAVTSERDLGEGRWLVCGTRTIGAELQGYLLMLARTRGEVYSFEAWGPSQAFDRAQEALVASALSLRR